MRDDKTLPLSAQYLLMVLDDDKGKFLIDTTTVDIGIAGASLLDLIAQGHLILEPGEKPGKAKLRDNGPGPDDETRADAWRKVNGRTFGKAIEALTGWVDFRNRAKTLRQNELLRLVDAGILAEEESKVLGLFTVERYPARDDAAEREIRARIEQVLVGGLDPKDESTGSLIALLNATSALPKAFPHLAKRDVTRRGREVSEGNWAGAEVRKAIDDMNAVIATVIIASSATTVASS